MFECKELSAKFETKQELLKSLVENKELAISKKKSEIVTHKFCQFPFDSKKDSDESKSESLQTIGSGDTIWATVNTTNFLDSHGDVHAKGIWNKTAKEQNNKIYYIINHDLDIGKVIAYPKDVNIHVLNKSWRELGYDADGNTEALTFEVRLTDFSNKDFINSLKAGANLQNSVRMRYISLDLCVSDKQFESEYSMWNKYISEVVNRKEAEELGYFWYVKEAALVHESSAVLFGSNSVTPISSEKTKDIEPSGDTQSNNKEEGAKTMPVWYHLM